MKFIESGLQFWKIPTSMILSCVLLLSAAPVFGQYAQTEKLLASDVKSDAEFGNAIATDGGRAIIGAHFDYNATGITAGSAYIFELGTTGNWTEVAKIRGDETQPESFGSSVDISGNRAIVGAPLENSAGAFAGAVYIFERDATGSWVRVAKILASDAEAGDRFGWSVAINGDEAIVGAINEDTGHSNAGKAYIFKRDSAGNWTETAQIQPGDITAVQEFANAVAVDGNTAVIGASKAGHAGGSFAGAAYIFERDAAGNWNEVGTLVASDAEPNDYFGTSVFIDGGRIIIGAPYEDAGGDEAGAAYIFERDAAGNWNQVSKLVASDAEPIDWFGYSVAISGNRAVVGAHLEDTGRSDAGAAYIFERDGAGNWSEAAKIQASDKEFGENFGKSVGISGSFILVGAPKDRDGFLIENGAVYVFAGAPVGIAGSTLPRGFELAQNYPNPFNPSTTIGFALPQSAAVSLQVFDINGQLVKTLLNGSRAAGTHRVVWDGTDQSGAGVASGVYLYRLSAGGFTQTRKMMLMK
jgi:hypothetical protein